MASSSGGTTWVFVSCGLLVLACHDLGSESDEEALLVCGDCESEGKVAAADRPPGLAPPPVRRSPRDPVDSGATDGTEEYAGSMPGCDVTDDEVCVREAEPASPTPLAEPAPFTAGSTVFVVLPDTQYYSFGFPGLLEMQTWWISEMAEELDIAYVFHLGDIVHKNTDLEWERANTAMSLLDGVVPYALVPGNHDYGPSGAATTRDTGLNTWFSFTDAAAMPSFGGAFEDGRLDNTYHLFAAGGREWIAVMLEWAPRDEVVAWADAVMTEHPDRLGILVTHAYLNNNDLRYDHHDVDHPQDYNPHDYATPGALNDGEELWQKLVRRHRFVMTLNGHVLGDGTGYLASVNDQGRTVHQMLANYQMREVGGQGYLRLLELLPDGRTVHVRSYSPLLDQYLGDADQDFAIELDVD